jgi:hypothetical protein
VTGQGVVHTTAQAIRDLPVCGRCGKEPLVYWDRTLREYGLGSFFPGGDSGGRISLPVCGGCRFSIWFLEAMPFLAPILSTALIFFASVYFEEREWKEPVDSIIIYGWLPVMILLRAIGVLALPVRVLKVHRDRTLTVRIMNPVGELPEEAPKRKLLPPPRAAPPGKPGPAPRPAPPPRPTPEPDRFAVSDAQEDAAARMEMYREQEKIRKSKNVRAIGVIVLGVVCFCVGAYLRVSETAIIAGWAVKGTGVALIVLGRVMWSKPLRLTRERRRR